MVAGRKRSFDKEHALDSAMAVFWSKGYSATSMTDLTEAMDINKPSLYAAFGNKEALFVSAMNKYLTAHGRPHLDALQGEASLESRLGAFLHSVSSMLCDAELPGGCMIVTCTSEAGSDCMPKVAEELVLDINAASLEFLTAFFEQEKTGGNLALSSSAAELAHYLLAIEFGLATMAKNRMARDQLDQVINRVVVSFPYA